MASNKLYACIFILSLLSSVMVSSACGTCPEPEPKSKPKPKPKPKPLPPPKGPPVNPFCPRDALKLGVCADVLGGLVHLVIGTPVSSECCALLEGLADVEAAACLCTAIKANVLGINLNVPVSLSLLLSACEKSIPPGFKCE